MRKQQASIHTKTDIWVSIYAKINIYVQPTAPPPTNSVAHPIVSSGFSLNVVYTLSHTWSFKRREKDICKLPAAWVPPTPCFWPYYMNWDHSITTPCTCVNNTSRNQLKVVPILEVQVPRGKEWLCGVGELLAVWDIWGMRYILYLASVELYPGFYRSRICRPIFHFSLFLGPIPWSSLWCHLEVCMK